MTQIRKIKFNTHFETPGSFIFHAVFQNKFIRHTRICHEMPESAPYSVIFRYASSRLCCLCERKHMRVMFGRGLEHKHWRCNEIRRLAAGAPGSYTRMKMSALQFTDCVFQWIYPPCHQNTGVRRGEFIDNRIATPRHGRSLPDDFGFDDICVSLGFG